KELLPSVFAFLLSFAIIATEWVNHHEAMKWVNKSTPRFVYANVFLLLTIITIPFTTSLLAEFGFTEAAAPAVVLYTFVILLCNVGWNLVTQTALKQKLLAKNAAAEAAMKTLSRNVRFAFILYLLCTVLAFWFPTLISIIITLSWVYWFILSFQIQNEILIRKV
ncbi:MAG TPA: TMEM175 family protein, partial [Flavitalea sp.]|nr:TMEM175 family protein [Flavitalea sp.]